MFNKEISAHLYFRYKGSLVNRNVMMVAITFTFVSKF